VPFPIGSIAAYRGAVSAGLNARLAVRIDAGCAQASLAGELLAGVSRHDVARAKRAYGDRTTAMQRG